MSVKGDCEGFLRFSVYIQFADYRDITHVNSDNIEPKNWVKKTDR